MPNNERFIQNLDDLILSDFDIKPPKKKKKLLPIGTVVELKSKKYGTIKIVGWGPTYEGKFYEYAGEFVDTNGKIMYIYFDEENIDNYVEKESRTK